MQIIIVAKCTTVTVNIVLPKLVLIILYGTHAFCERSKDLHIIWSALGSDLLCTLMRNVPQPFKYRFRFSLLCDIKFEKKRERETKSIWVPLFTW